MAWTVGFVVIGAALRWIVRGRAVPQPETRESRTAASEGSPRAAGRFAFVVSILAALGLAVVYWRGGQPQWEGALLCRRARRHRGRARLVGPPLPAARTVTRRSGASSPRARRRSRPWTPISMARRGGARSPRACWCACWPGRAGALGLAALFPLRSLGPRPGAGPEGQPLHRGRPPRHRAGRARRARTTSAVDGFITVFPEGNAGRCQRPTLLIHTRPGQNSPRPGREDWAVDDLVAFSKICTHAGCPVGLVPGASGLLLCPCHQSTFDVGDGCDPVFGPATRLAPPAPAGARRRRLPRRRRRLLQPRSAPASGTSCADGPQGAAHRSGWCAGSTGASVAPAWPASPSTRCSRTTGRSCSARWRSTASSSWCSPAPTSPLFFSPSTRQVTYDGSYGPLRGVEMSRGLRVRHPPQLRRAGRAW